MFKRVYIEITNICNLSCSFCPQHTRKLEYMSIDSFSHILNQIKPYTNEIYLHLMGEPLLHPKLDELLSICDHETMNVKITTNATMLSKQQTILKNHSCIKQINLSLHSFTEHNGENQMKYIKDVFSFINNTRSNDFHISLRLWNLGSDSDINKVIKEEIQNNLGYKFNDEDKYKTSGIKLVDRVWLNQDHIFTWPINSIHSNTSNQYCHGGSSHIGILVDGSVVLCCLDNQGRTSFGNIYTTDLKDILINPDYLKSIQGFNDNKALHPLCATCSFKDKFE